MMNENATRPQNPLIRLVDVTKVYRLGSIEVNALAGITLDIQQGEFISIVGASGSGKSTLINIIGCLDTPTSGEYILEGESVSEMSANQLASIRGNKVGFVFQTHNLLPRLTALANVELPMMYGKWHNRRQRARQAMEAVGIADRMHHRPTELSGGQQQRAGIARALVKQPNILIADEPTGNLDSTTTEDIVKVIAALNRDDNITVILVTHEPDIAAQTDRIITLRDGKVISDESPTASLPESPTDATVSDGTDAEEEDESVRDILWVAARKIFRRLTHDSASSNRASS